MKPPDGIVTYFFVDEAGDPIFYNRHGELIVGQEGCSRILILGFIRTTNPEHIRQALIILRAELSKDPYFKGIPSIERTLRYFHAKDDVPEVRERVYKTLQSLDFKAEFVVARKIETIFNKRHRRKENVFYDDLVSKLFENKLHTSSQNIIYFAVRGNRIRQEPLDSAIHTAILTFESKWQTKISTNINAQAQTLIGEPCLQAADYMNWAVQRAFNKGDTRFFHFMREKISFLVDLYDYASYPHNFYNSKNQFDITKISPL